MRQARFRMFGGAVVLILIPLAAGCTSGTAMTPSATVTTAVQGWENWLRLDWTAQARPNGQEIDGYVYNKYGSALYNVRVLAQGLDGSGAVVNQQVAWVSGTVPTLRVGIRARR